MPGFLGFCATDILGRMMFFAARFCSVLPGLCPLDTNGPVDTTQYPSPHCDSQIYLQTLPNVLRQICPQIENHQSGPTKIFKHGTQLPREGKRKLPVVSRFGPKSSRPWLLPQSFSQSKSHTSPDWRRGKITLPLKGGEAKNSWLTLIHHTYSLSSGLVCGPLSCSTMILFWVPFYSYTM